MKEVPYSGQETESRWRYAISFDTAKEIALEHLTSLGCVEYTKAPNAYWGYAPMAPVCIDGNLSAVPK